MKISLLSDEAVRVEADAGLMTVEADSGGHTDNRPAITLLPTILALRDRLQEQYRYAAPLRRLFTVWV